MRLVRFAFVFLTLAAATLLRAQSVRWENGDGSAVLLVFEDCEPDGDPVLPAIPNATLTLNDRSTTVNMVNMSVTRSVILGYLVQARRAGPLQIPAFTVKTNKGALRVAAFNGAAPTVSADSVATSKLIPERTTVWAGEVFGLTYRLTAASRNNPQFGRFTFDWNAAPLVAEAWSNPTGAETVIDGQRHIVATTSTRAYAKSTPSVTLDAVHQVVQVQTGAVGFGLFSQARMEPVSITSDQPVLEVRPLPAAPPGFTGAVGQFKLTSKVVPADASVGEPVTWTLELTGTGNWPEINALPSREVAKDFEVVQPKAKRTTAEGKLFEATLTEDVVLVPTKAGRYTLGPVTFAYFDPKAGRYETIQTERTTITIKPPMTVSMVGATVGSPNATAGVSAAPAAPAPRAPGLPGSIPRDALAGRGDAPRPLALRPLLAWLIAPFGGVLLLWLALAWRRALRTDPIRPRREAHARLTGLLTQMQASAGTPAPEQLRAWQRDSATLWGVAHAAPATWVLAAATNDARGGSNSPTDGAAWATLWREADRALYGPRPELPADWVARAEAALEAKRIPSFQPHRLFLPRNLLPFAAALAVAALLPLTAFAVPALAPEASYRAGNFAAAEEGWRAALAQNSTDWIAHHNLSLALTQQDKAGPAAAHAVAALVQHPNDPAVRWNFAYTAGKAGFAPDPLMPLLKDGPTHAIATLAGPAGWQRWLIVAAGIDALALGLMLVNAYGPRRRALFWTASGAGAAAIVLALVALFGLRVYGETAHADAVITWETTTLRSIPTEADTTQKTSALPAGSVARVDREFVGWKRLVFSNGQTGWVRQEELVPLW
ncbi:BatD family protein [Opitutus sp. ER46]|uniref:BatD family protein n=1 Tax=Opitutus sp. ER46 TaxID=2161864 RepID=UPI001304E7B8|nr:BatD family protein [Opitutus sp. ER46]